MPMFPLHTVLFPHSILPLHIFETRYKVLAEECVRDVSEFGVVLIQRGSSVGGGDQRYDVGTLARVVEAGQTSDGRWIMATVGTQRIKVHSWLPDDPYPVALVERLPESVLDVVDRPLLEEARDHLGEVLQMGAQLQLTAELPPQLSDDPERSLWELVAAAPISAIDQQRLLATDEPLLRIQALREVLTDIEAVFRFQLSE